MTEIADIVYCFWQEADLGYKFTLQIFPKMRGDADNYSSQV